MAGHGSFASGSAGSNPRCLGKMGVPFAIYQMALGLKHQRFGDSLFVFRDNFTAHA